MMQAGELYWVDTDHVGGIGIAFDAGNEGKYTGLFLVSNGSPVIFLNAFHLKNDSYLFTCLTPFGIASRRAGSKTFESWFIKELERK